MDGPGPGSAAGKGCRKLYGRAADTDVGDEQDTTHLQDEVKG